MTLTYGRDTTTDELLEGRDLSGRRVLITGASAGLGAETSRALAARGADIIMLVRDLAKGVRPDALDPERAAALWARNAELAVGSAWRLTVTAAAWHGHRAVCHHWSDVGKRPAYNPTESGLYRQNVPRTCGQAFAG